MESTFGIPLKRHEEYMRDKVAEIEATADRIGEKIDLVNQPPHYLHGDIECIDAIRAALGEKGFAAFCRGNCIKYNWRANHKHEDALEDTQKAVWYLNKLIDTMRTKAEHTIPQTGERTP